MIALTGSLRKNCGPTIIDRCDMDAYDLAGALRGNMSIKLLSLDAISYNDDHPVFQHLDIGFTAGPSSLSAGEIAARMQSLLEMLQKNEVLHTIIVSEDEVDDRIFQGSIRPRLQANLYRPRARAIKQVRDLLLRRKILGRAMQAAVHKRNNSNVLWMLLSVNAGAAFPPEEQDNGVKRKRKVGS
jgi:hypothetical protein